MWLCRVGGQARSHNRSSDNPFNRSDRLTMRETPRTPGGRRPRILVPTDFSPCSDAALGCAKRIAAKMRGSVSLLHVIAHPAIGVTFGSELCAPESLEARARQ
jgi:hypothetical protein